MEKKQKIKIILSLSLGILIVSGLVVSVILEKPSEQVPETVELKASLESLGANQLGFLFFEDSNINGEFDWEEKVVKNVSVAVRRPGETAAFITVPAEVNGLVKVNQLAAGKYEIQYLNSELEQPYQAGDFEFKRYYQIVEAGRVRFSFLPSEWQTIELTESGYQLKVGIKEYQPESLLVISDKGKIKFYDPVRAKVLGMSQSGQTFKLKSDSLFYFKDNDLTKFGTGTRLTQVVADRLFDININNYWLNQDGSGLLYLNEEKRWQYESEALGCSSTLRTGNYENLAAGGERELADLDENQLAVLANTKSEGVGTYLGVCREKGKLELKRFDLGNITSLKFLDKENWFYSNSNGSYFFNFVNGQSTKYAALGTNAAVIISQDKKYLAASLDGSTIVVDYPAVKQSGVEKHYVLPFSGQLAFSGDEVLISQTKTC
ncbi:MAG: hypothetical protein V1810_00505, partial [Candidatus Beckwithbacteria bacterium]